MQMTCLLTAVQRLTRNNYKQSKSMAHPHHCLVTQKLQSTYFNVLYAYFIIGPNVRSHYDVRGFDSMAATLYFGT